MRDIGLLLLKHPSQVSLLRKNYEKDQVALCRIPAPYMIWDLVCPITRPSYKKFWSKNRSGRCRQRMSPYPAGVHRYLKDYHRVKTVYEQNQDLNYIHIVTGLAKHVVQQYVNIVNHENFYFTCHLAITLAE